MNRIFKYVFEKKISSSGLAVFRIFFSLNLFFEVLRVFRYRQLYFDPMPYIDSASSVITVSLVLWMLVLLCLVAGFLTKFMTIINYALALLVIDYFHLLEYHMNHIYLGVGFLMMFLPLNGAFSVDRLLKNRQTTNPEVLIPKVSVFYYYIVLLVGVAFVYFDSIFFKFKSDLWSNGLGLWLPASVPQVTILNNQWLLNQEVLVKFLGYLTVFFELIFPFTFFLKRFRIPLLIVGIGLHFGILLEYPIPYFGWGYLAIYMLMVPVSFWDKIIVKIRSWFSSEEKMVPNLTYKEVLVSSREKKFLKIIVTIILIFQFNSTFNFPLSEGIVNRIESKFPNAEGTLVTLKNTKRKVRRLSAKTLGITSHGVFVDSHFEGFNSLYSIRYKDELLPMYDENGMPDEYLLGGTWIDFNYRVNKPYVENSMGSLTKGLKRYTAFWAYKNNISLKDARFTIVRKKINVALEFEKDALKNNMQTPWEAVGEMRWKDDQATLQFYDIP